MELTPPAEIEFEEVVFWIRMSNLPLACMGREVGHQIRSTVGLVEMDDEGVGWGKYLRVRVKLDLSKSLSQGRILKLEEKTIWVPFQYERLPRYCFDCGTIRLGRAGCLWRNEPQTYGSVPQFGPWLRVPSLTRRMDRLRSNFRTEKKTNASAKEPYKGRGGKCNGSQAKARWSSVESSAGGGRDSLVTQIRKEQNS
jgi:hypothetical protein